MGSVQQVASSSTDSGVPVATLDRWRYVGRGPPAIRVERHLRFDQDHLAGWISGRKGDSDIRAIHAGGADGGC